MFIFVYFLLIYQFSFFWGSSVNTKTTAALFVTSCVSLVFSTILEEEKVQQKERSRMEMRRQVTVSWDSGGSDEAPPKVRHALHGF